MESTKILSSVLSIIFFFIMVAVIYSQFKKNKTADSNKTIEHFDGIDEKDAPIPKVFFAAYLIAFIGAIVYVLLYPSLASWKGFVGWTQADDAYVAKSVDINNDINGAINAHTDEETFTLLQKEPLVIQEGKAIFGDNCSACHGLDATGQHNYPNLVDKDWLYGGSPQDIYTTIYNGRHGKMPAWKEVLNGDDIDELTQYVSQLNKGPFESNDLFDANCSSCHGKDAQGTHGIGAPNLTNNIWLHGSTKDDIKRVIENGMSNTMPAFSERLTRNQMLSLTSYILSLQNEPQENIGLMQAKTYIFSRNEKPLPAVLATCVGCHGADGLGGVPGTPKLAGLKEAYIYNQLNLFVSGLRQNTTMQGMTANLSVEDKLLAASYFSSLDSPDISEIFPDKSAEGLIKDPTERLIFQGDWQRALPACATCHGQKTEGNPSFPRLAGQSSDYLEKQLFDWRTGVRSGDQGQMMQNVVRKLTDDEIKSLSKYLSKIK
ncbi:cytochrome-c oxidase, cbb3-type subunit III [Shewanella psychropiezotolerans]|uniref:Cytochrome c oxidase subunit III n=1 Tax=Shewanella psychropiezotolerans TaxID=2593655 RepID=A0ABX5WZY1_9GAMM|nr:MULTISPECIES: cytochrome-c oxidase, cbb3-type subunit III [Shewanella]MPY22383.1 cytochrome-c oxidase, cbb3-type subunit III [Shewanella sp. YLB-07]QDO83293.1 cytochrome-c oxidase, cbb3-type subunit III [Shewanella psychropiezotolerans]